MCVLSENALTNSITYVCPLRETTALQLARYFQYEKTTY